MARDKCPFCGMPRSHIASPNKVWMCGTKELTNEVGETVYDTGTGCDRTVFARLFVNTQSAVERFIKDMILSPGDDDRLSINVSRSLLADLEQITQDENGRKPDTVALSRCRKCNGYLSRNPSEEAGMPGSNEGSYYVCIPCLIKECNFLKQRNLSVIKAADPVIDWFSEDPHMVTPENIDIVDIVREMSSTLVEERQHTLAYAKVVRRVIAALRQDPALVSIDWTELISELESVNNR